MSFFSRLLVNVNISPEKKNRRTIKFFASFYGDVSLLFFCLIKWRNLYKCLSALQLFLVSAQRSAHTLRLSRKPKSLKYNRKEKKIKHVIKLLVAVVYKHRIHTNKLVARAFRNSEHRAAKQSKLLAACVRPRNVPWSHPKPFESFFSFSLLISFYN